MAGCFERGNDFLDFINDRQFLATLKGWYLFKHILFPWSSLTYFSKVTGRVINFVVRMHLYIALIIS